jgi:hypothetical protein
MTHDTSPRLTSPDDVFEALIEAQAELSAEDADLFRARLILLLANQLGDDEAVKAAIAVAREGLGEAGEN